MAVPPKIIFNEDYGFVEIVIVYKMKLLCLSFGTNCDFRVLFPDGSGYVFWVAFVSSFWVLRIVSVHLSWGWDFSRCVPTFTMGVVPARQN